DNLSRLVGRAEKPSAGAVDTSWNTCRWDGTGRNAQPCNGFQSTFVGPNVVRTSNGWFFVQAPGIDEPLLLIFRNPSTWQMQERLQAVTDGAGQLIAIADSAGEIDASYAGSGYGQTSWRGAGVMTRGQTFSPRRWETDAQWGDVQQFRNRAYDPGSGRWLQEDPIGVAGGINLYEYNGNDPVTWRDPFGLQPCCLVEAANIAAGFGDAMTFGLTNKVRDRIGANRVINRTGTTYTAGELAGLGAGVGLGAASAQAIRTGATFATSGPAKSITTALLRTEAGQALFGKGAILNEGSAFRVGVSRAKDGGRFVFRVAGELVEKVAGRSKIDLVDLGRIQDFLRRP
ncbi:MAG TPA: RHS repeat-associated core domain-containing protein, partial [Gemmatimonadales bacterium]|nr:RHS repeat-associated core domain-containing protein [Gemmatimonadales bacterium]